MHEKHSIDTYNTDWGSWWRFNFWIQMPHQCWWGIWAKSNQHDWVTMGLVLEGVVKPLPYRCYFSKIASEPCLIYLLSYMVQWLCLPYLISFFFLIQFETCKVCDDWFVPHNALALSYILHSTFFFIHSFYILLLSHLNTGLIDW